VHFSSYAGQNFFRGVKPVAERQSSKNNADSPFNKILFRTLQFRHDGCVVIFARFSAMIRENGDSRFFSS
jgi:hypothetical protein